MKSNGSPSLPRRQLLTTMVVSPALVGTGSAIAAIDPRNLGADFGALYRKLRYRSDDGVLFWWLSGTKYAVTSDNAVTPLHGLEACAIIRVRTTEHGFSATSLEHVFYTDLTTGHALSQVVNPLTGETVQYRRNAAKPLTTEYRADASFDYPTTLGSSTVDFKRECSLLKSANEEIWIQDNSTTVITSSDGLASRSNDWSTFRCRHQEIINPRMRIPASTVHMQSVQSWPAWLKMGNRPGGLTARTIGAKVSRFDQVPTSWRTLLKEAHPEVARDPIGALGT